MLETLARLAIKLHWSKPLVIVIGACFFGWFCLNIFGVLGTDSDAYLIPSVLGLLWSVLLFFLLTTFLDIPPKPQAEASFLIRLKTRIKRSFYYLLGLIFLLLTIAVSLYSFRMLGIWMSDH